MNTHQLCRYLRTFAPVCAALLATVPLAACNRSDTRDNARVAAAEVKDAAGRAGEKIADSWLATKIQAQYFADDDVKARNILVSARDGIVTLRGHVDNAEAHRQAVEIAKNTDGVTQVNDQLTGASSSAAPEPIATSGIVPTAPPSVAERLDDAGVTASIQAKYFLDSNIKARRIEVDTHQGVVTLRGEVASDDERAQALILARTTQGVERVEDALTVNLALAQPAEPPSAPSASAAPAAPAPNAAVAQDAALADQIESKLQADRRMASSAVEVTAKDGVVLLEGTVPTPAAKQQALRAARETQGVLQVIDRLKVGRAR